MTSRTRAGCLSDEQVSAFALGMVSGEERRVIESHIADCGQCGKLVAMVVSAQLSSTSEEAAIADGPLARGDRVGRYEIEAILGAGAMGTVYAAHDPALDRRVALKLIRAHVAAPDLEARLLREAKAMARLTHPEVIAVYDAGRHGDRVFIAMELVEGGTLREWLHAAPRTWREILAIYLRAGRGLAQAHAAGIVHRDFKPDNVLVGKGGAVRVTDFGLARAERGEASAPLEPDAPIEETPIDATLTRTGALVGTPVYMAPEQLAGRTADARSDIYSYCVALHEALYGERPFSGRTVSELLAAKSANDVRAEPAGSKVAPRLRRVLLKGLRADPDERFATMEQLLDALDRASRARRWPLAIGAAAFAAGAAIALGTLGAHRTTIPAAPSASASIAHQCTTSRSCVAEHGGAPYVCRASDATCVPLESEDCVAKHDAADLTSDDTVWLGALLPMKGAAATEYGATNVEGAELARQELARATRALDGPNAALRVRRVGLLACDDGSDPMRAATHLVDVGVPAILGFGSGQELIDLASSLLVKRRVLAVATLTPNPFVTRVPQPRDLPPMVWRTTYGLDAVASASAHFASDFFAPRLGERSRMRVVLVRENQPAGVSFGESLSRQLVLDGKPAIESPDYRETTFPSGAVSDADLARVVSDVVGARASLVVLVGANETILRILESVEARAGAARPTYLVANSTFEAFRGYLGGDLSRRRRLFSVFSDSSASSNARFVMRYNAAHTERVTVSANPSSTYDAFYLLAYAAYALGEDAVTGPALARAFGRLVPPGETIEVGPTQVLDALRILAAGKPIDLEGAASALDFDLATGEAPADFALACAGIDARGRASGADVESGVVYRTKPGKVVGTLRCP